MRAVKGEHAVCVSLCGLAGYGAGGTDGIYEISEYHGLEMSIKNGVFRVYLPSPVWAVDYKMADQAGHDELKFVLHIADDLAVEEVYDALGAGCVFL